MATPAPPHSAPAFSEGILASVDRAKAERDCSGMHDLIQDADVGRALRAICESQLLGLLSGRLGRLFVRPPISPFH